MTIKEILVQDLHKTLEETSGLIADKLILESLAKNGSITLQEAEFQDALVRRVITEAADEFVPEDISTPEKTSGMILTGEDGTIYSFADGVLTPVEGAEPASAQDDPALPEDENEPAMNDDLNESTQPASEIVELTESQTIVSNLIKSLGA